MDAANPPGSLDSPVVKSDDLKEVSRVGNQEGEVISNGVAISTEAATSTEVAISTEGVITKGAKSWVTAAQNKKSLKKFDVAISTQDGKHKVMIPDEVLVDQTPLWDDFIVGKFLDLAPHMAKVHMVVNKIWKYGELDTKVDVYEISATTMRFRISSSKAREKILKRGMWNIAGVPMVVLKWSPKREEEKQEENEIPMWVHLRKVPLHMYSWEGISFMSSTVGFPDRLHPETIACTNMEVAKVFVNVDISKQLPKEIDFTKDGKEFTVEFHYPWLPAKCNLCGKRGHTERVCVKNGKEKRKRVDSKDQSEGSGVKEARVLGNSHEDIDKEQAKTDAMMSPQVNQGDKSVSPKESNISNWSLVSPAKVGRLQSTQSLVPEIEISASKFSVLGDEIEEAEEGELIEDDPENNEEEKLDAKEEGSEFEGDLLEDDILKQHTKEKNKVGAKKGARRVQRGKAQDANPKSTRPSRKKN